MSVDGNNKEEALESKMRLLDDLQSMCTGCGLCSEGCATFQSLGWEHESPRGRIHFAAEFLQGHVDLQSPALSTFDRCLGCRSCEPLCPQKLPYGKLRSIVQDIRRELQSAALTTMSRSEYKRWIQLASRMGSVWWRGHGRSLLQLFYRNFSFQKRSQKNITVSEPTQVLAICCLQDLFQTDVIDQTVAFMQRLGCPVRIDKNQPCCGAIYQRLLSGGESIAYQKEYQQAQCKQKRTLQEFLDWMPANICFLAMGCQSYISEYMEEAPFDLYGWIGEILARNRFTLYFPNMCTIFYQPYCGVVREDPIWQLFQNIEGLRVHYVFDAQSCCGGYCGEALLHPKNAENIVKKKLSAIPEDAILVVTSPDCWSLFSQQMEGRKTLILYPIQLLARASIRLTGS